LREKPESLATFLGSAAVLVALAGGVGGDCSAAIFTVLLIELHAHHKILSINDLASFIPYLSAILVWLTPRPASSPAERLPQVPSSDKAGRMG